MALETASFISELTVTNPVGATDPKSAGDDHIRLIKTAVKGTFPNFVGTAGVPKSVTLTEDELNDCLQKAINNVLLGRLETDDSTTTRAGLNVPNGVAPTSPVQGDIWATASDVLVRNNGANRSLIGGGITKHKTADESRDTDSTPSDDTHMKDWVLEAATFYRVTGYLKVSSGSATPDFQFLFVTDNAFQEASGNYLTISASANVAGFNRDAMTTATIVQIFGTGQSGILIEGFVFTHASLASNVDFQWAQGTSNGTATVLERGSSIKFEKMP